MRMKKLIGLLLALALALSVPVLAEGGDAEARVAELEAQVEELTRALEEAQAALKAYEEQSYVATFDGGVVTLEEAQSRYKYIVSMYQAYGYSISGYEDYIRQDLLNMLAEEAVVNYKAREMGYADLDAEALASYEAEAAMTHDSYLTSYMTYLAEEGKSEAEVRAETEEYLEQMGYSYDKILESMIATHAQQALFEAVTADIEITEEDVRAAYDSAVAEDEQAYADNAYDYESARADGTPVYWNPEGYRRVKHVLIKFDDDQTARYTELKDLADDLEARIEAANGGEAEADAEAATDAEPSPEAEPVDVEALEEQLTGTLAEMDALYHELLPRTEEVLARFEEGEDFESLIAEYGEDPGMENEPGKTEGYYVSENSVMWDAAFTEGAMSIAAPGQISEPVHGSYGVHIIYYLADVPAGAVPYEDVRDSLQETALSDARNQAYSDQVAAWKEELHLELHPERFK